MGYGLADRNTVAVIYACLSDEIKRQLCTSTRLPRIWKVIPRHVFMNLIRHVISAPDGRTYATSLLHAAKQKDTEDVVAFAHRLAIIMTAVGTMKQTERGLTLPTAHSRDLFTHYLSQGLKDEESKGIVKAEPHIGEEVYTYIEGLAKRAKLFKQCDGEKMPPTKPLKQPTQRWRLTSCRAPTNQRGRRRGKQRNLFLL